MEHNWSEHITHERLERIHVHRRMNIYACIINI